MVKRITKEIGGKKYYKAPRISRLLTNKRLRRKRVKSERKLEKLVQNQEMRANFLKKLENRKAESKN